MISRSLFTRYSWSFLAFTILVITWGALVRATGSGAGCGDHWPLCNGIWIPVHPQLATIIELTHRAMSGLSLVGVLLLAWAAHRLFPKNSAVRQSAYVSVALMLSEALIGAGLVVLRLVAHDTSGLRAIYLSVHLINTFLLVAALTSTSWWSTQDDVSGVPNRGLSARLIWYGAAGIGLLGVGVAGGIAALGDTLFPSTSLAQGLANDLNPSTHFLIHLRVLHPILAMVVGTYLFIVGGSAVGSPSREVRRYAWILMGLVLLQWALGTWNLIALAPIALQLIHLATADILWIVWILFMWSVWREPESLRPA